MADTSKTPKSGIDHLDRPTDHNDRPGNPLAPHLTLINDTAKEIKRTLEGMEKSVEVIEAAVVKLGRHIERTKQQAELAAYQNRVRAATPGATSASHAGLDAPPDTTLPQ